MKNMKTNLDDVLISVSIPDYYISDHNVGLVIDLADQLDQEYKFWEVLIVAESSGNDEYSNILSNVGNVRILQVNQYTDFYLKRSIGAMEAIGDIVVLTSISEMGSVNIVELINRVRETDSLVMVEGSKRYIFDLVLKLIGRVAGFRVSLKYLLTSGYPRSIIGQLLRQSHSQVGLRFSPTHLGKPETIFSSTSYRRSRGGLLRRINLVQDLLFSAAPRLLSYMGSLCIIVLLCSIFYSIYAVVVWALFETVQQGWLTTSLVLSLGLGFTSLALFALCAGLKQLIDTDSVNLSNCIVGETSSVEMYQRIKDDINVEKISS
jgi:hypothetical protein